MKLDFKMANAFEPGTDDYTQMIVKLMLLGQELCSQTHDVVPRLCQEVAQITKDQAVLRFYTHQMLERAQPVDTLTVNIPVQFHQRHYGVLQIATDAYHLMSPMLPIQIAHLIAQVCGCILYAIEQSVLVYGRSSQLPRPLHVCLTKREKEVLALIGYCYSNNRIAEALMIAPTTVTRHRQSIYEQLNVHNERDALLIAYQIGLFSPLEEGELPT